MTKHITQTRLVAPTAGRLAAELAGAASGCLTALSANGTESLLAACPPLSAGLVGAVSAFLIAKALSRTESNREALRAALTAGTAAAAASAIGSL